MLSNTVALDEYLKPLNHFINDASISEILINHPNSLFIEQNGFFKEYEDSSLSYRHLIGLANLIARFTDQRLSEKEPLLSGQLPSGHRVQIILPPATSNERIIISIRKQTINDISLDDYCYLNTFKNTKPFYLSYKNDQLPLPQDQELIHLFNHNRYIEFLKFAVENKKNILISGGTSTGKTTFLNALLKEIPDYEHLVTLEDVPELKCDRTLHTPLFTSKGLQGFAQITMQDLIQASLRIRPDRIIMGEMRGAEAADFIHATSTGHDGSISSIHASSPDAAFMRLVHMIKLSGTNLTREDLLSDLHTIIDIVVQLERKVIKNVGIREVSYIYYKDAREE